MNFASSILQFEKGIIGHDVKCRKPILQHNELVWWLLPVYRDDFCK